MFRRLEISVLLAALAVVAATSAGALPKPKERWIELRTASFTLYSDASPAFTRRVGLNLERLRRALTGISPDKEVRSPIPTYIYVFRSSRSYERYSDPDTAGLFTSGETGNYVAINADPGLDPYAIVYHEYIHDYMHNNSRAPLPTWFDEGTAEYYSTFTVAENEVEIGRPLPSHVEWLSSHAMLPLDDLFAITTDSPDYNEGDKRGVFYAQSWVVVHYLHSGDRAPQLTTFLEMLEEGRPTADAFRSAFDTSYEGLLAEVKAYIRKGAYPFTRYTFTQLAINEQVSIETLPRADLLSRLGDYLVHRGPESAGSAEEHFRAALDLEPEHAGALAGLGFVRELAGDPEQAATLYAAALEGDPDNFATHLRLGRILVQRDRLASPWFAPEKPLSPMLVAAREHFRRTIELNPGLGPAYSGFGYTYVTDPGDIEPGIRALEKALALMPGSETTAVNLYALYMRSGDVDAADALVRTILQRSDDPEILAFVRTARLREELSGVDALVREGRVREAVELVTRVRDRTTDPDMRAHLDEVLAQASRAVRLQEAFDLADAGRLAEAEELLVELLGDLDDPAQRQIVEQTLEQIRTLRSEP